MSSVQTFQWSEQQEKIFSWFAQPVTEDRPLLDRADDVTGRRNLVVTARAGTGKTTTIIEGVNRAPEKRIILCAFNKKIAVELATRITNPGARAATLHSLGYACVQRFWERIRIAEKVSDRADSLTEKVCGQRAPDTIKRLVSQLHTKGREMAPHAIKAGDLTDIQFSFSLVPDEQWENAGFDALWIERKALDAMELAATVKPIGGIDFADQIFLPCRNGWLMPQADLVVVDEAQDMTLAQLEIAEGVCDGRICVVGDDRQAIYGFRGADSEALSRLKRKLHAQELTLTVTRRCAQSIVRLAQELVPDFTCAPEVPEGEILEIAGEKLVQMAGPGDFILSRLNAPLVSVAMKLLRSGKRTSIAGRDIGKGLITLVRKLKGRSVPDYLEKVRSWQDRETLRLRKAKKEHMIEGIEDQAEMLISLADDARSIDEVVIRIDNLFTDDGLGEKGRITCSSVHRSKGLEADRVFILRATLRDGDIEEQNIRYVAITRAKRTLVWVNGNGDAA